MPDWQAIYSQSSHCMGNSSSCVSLFQLCLHSPAHTAAAGGQALRQLLPFQAPSGLWDWWVYVQQHMHFELKWQDKIQCYFQCTVRNTWLASWGSITVREDFKIKTLKSILHSAEKASSIRVKWMLEDTGKGKGEMKALISLNLNFENSWYSCPKSEFYLCLLTVLISKRKGIHHGCYIHNAVEEQDAVTQNAKK